MLRSLMAAIATAGAASKVRGLARQAAYGTVAVFALLVALVFMALAAFYALSVSQGPAVAAAIVAAGLAALAGLVFLWSAYGHQESEQEGFMSQLGLPALGISNQKDIEAVLHRARVEMRKVGPVKISLGALAVGFLLAALRR
jgi:hypothetical protein